jgi:hypothetical protein
MNAFAQRRRRPVVVPRPRARIVVRPGHPIRRPLPQTVIVRAPGKVVTVGAPLVFLTPVVWTATVVSLPARRQLLWQDSERIERDEDRVDCNPGVDDRGKALYLGLRGRARLNFAEITFDNGHVQVVDFEEHPRDSGTYRLLDFADGRRVATVRLLAKAESPEATLTVFLAV